MRLGQDEAEFLVRLARSAIFSYVVSAERIKVPAEFPPSLETKAGVFVTLTDAKDGSNSLRSCAGIPFPEKSIAETTIEAALASSTRDAKIYKFQSVVFAETEP